MLCSNISRLRKERGLTQAEFSKKLHVTQSAVSHWESGRSIPDTVQLFNIAKFFGVAVEELSKECPEPKAKDLEEPKKTPADKRAEAKAMLESMTDEQYQVVLQYLKFLKSQQGG